MAFSALTMGYFIRRTNLVEWVILAAATFLLYWPGLVSDLSGLVLVVVVWLSQRNRDRRDAAGGARVATA